MTDGKIRVLLVTSRSKGDWIFPKGTVEDGLSSLETAAKETFEEAGVKGRIDPEPLGEYHYTKNGRSHRVCMYRLQVEEELSVWPETDRRRRWADWDEAVRLVDSEAIHDLLISIDGSWRGMRL